MIKKEKEEEEEGTSTKLHKEIIPAYHTARILSSQHEKIVRMQEKETKQNSPK